MKTKYALPIILCLTGILVGGCSNTRQVMKDGKRVITFWHTHNDEETVTLKEIIADYESKNPNIKIDYQQVPFTDAETKYQTVAQAKNSPDVFRSEIAWTAKLAALGYLIAVDNFATEEYRKDFLKAPLKYNYYDGHYWGVPDVTDCLAFMYNKRIFKEANLSVPKTTEELISIGKKLTYTKDGKDKYALFFRGDTYWFLPFLASFGGGMVDEKGDILINSQESINAAQYLIDLRLKHKIVPYLVDFANDYDNQQTGFKTGKYAMIINGPWSTSDLLTGQEFKDNNDNLGITKIPAGPKGYATPVGGHNFVISSNRETTNKKDTEHLKEVWKFVSFMTLPENEAKYALNNNLLPARHSTYELPQVKSNRFITDFKDVLETGFNRPVIPRSGALFVDMKQPYQAALMTNKTIKEAFDEIAKAWEKLLKAE